MSTFSFDSESGLMTVCGEFCLYQAQEAKAALLQAASQGTLKRLDLSSVTEFDCAALQLVLSLGNSVSIDGMSDRVRSVLALLNVTIGRASAEEQV